MPGETGRTVNTSHFCIIVHILLLPFVPLPESCQGQVSSQHCHLKPKRSLGFLLDPQPARMSVLYAGGRDDAEAGGVWGTLRQEEKAQSLASCLKWEEGPHLSLFDLPYLMGKA